MRGRKNIFPYYLYILLTLIASLGVIFSSNLLVLIVFWGFLGLLLYLLISFGENKNTPATAKKALIIIGGSDAIMLLGLAMVWKITGTLEISKIKIALDSNTAIAAYLCLACGAFAKAGLMPFHTWIPDTAQDAPAPVTAYLPASLDKLLGIYLLCRLSLNLFIMNPAMNTLLMVMGSITIVAAVMMALVQHDLKRLLGYHAVSQVGYMVLGIGTGTALGIAAGLFHMLNHAIYKSCLFFSAGNVEQKAGTTDLDKLGGYAKFMPVTFITFLIASLAISGIPPFNGFASKWMIYQAIVDSAKTGNTLWMIYLAAAMFGSALTLASFMKLINAVFLGQPADKTNASIKQGEAPLPMLAVGIVLAALCVLFGVFAYQLPLKNYIIPSVGPGLVFPGVWNSPLATILLLSAIIIGLLFYWLGVNKKPRETRNFIGGEILEDHPQMRVSGTEFYNTISDAPPFKNIYRLAEEKNFDLYESGKKIVFWLNGILNRMHNGIISNYLAWCLLGMIILFYALSIK
jgi:NADH:ubiquinone oxidoreductase subunit 5 (subunit L)/multisubunit Na+/H+ antiporter MnhA subunit